MKEIVIDVLILTLLISHSAQASYKPEQNKEQYLLRSEKEKKTAWSLFGAGLGVSALGAITQIQEDSFNFSGTWIALVGGAISLSSIPIFISSGVHSRKATSLSLKNQQILNPRFASKVFTSVSSVSLKIIF